MESLNKALQEIGISKVKLAKYLGVSRQMVYNYLDYDEASEWPKEKRLQMMQLLGVKELNNKEIDKIVYSHEYLSEIDSKLNIAIKSASDIENYLDISGLNKNSKTALIDLTFLVKEILLDDNSEENLVIIKYLHNFLQTIENVPETKYILAYMAKVNGHISADEFSFNENKQFIFESILYSALNLYNNGGASKSKLIESRRRFVNEIERKKEEKLGRTQQLFAFKEQALKELGYNEINHDNHAEVFEKLAEIESRKVIINEHE